MQLLIQLLLNGIVTGSVYALVAVGFALIFGATQHFHIAHAAVFGAAGYIVYLFTSRLEVPIIVAVLATLTLMGVAGAVLVHYVYGALARRGGGGFVLFIVSLGLLIVVDNAFTIALGAAPARATVGDWFSSPASFGSWSLTGGQIVIIVASLLMFSGLVAVLKWTSAGKLVKAFSGNPEFVEIIGKSPKRVLILVYAVGSVLAATAGVYVAADTGMTPGLGEAYFIISLMAVFLGGIGSVAGAFTAAMILGILQNVLLLRIDFEWTLPILFSLFIVIIAVSPQGLASIKFPKLRGAP